MGVLLGGGAGAALWLHRNAEQGFYRAGPPAAPSRVRGWKHQWLLELYNLPKAIRIDDFDVRQRSNSAVYVDVARLMDQMVESLKGHLAG